MRRDVRVRSAAALAVCLAATALAPWFASGCKSDPRQAAREAACTADRAQLRSLVDEDKQTDKILQAADLAASKGRGAEAAALITNQASPATIRISERAAAWKPASQWGKDLQDFLVLLLQARVHGMKAYADALRSDDLKRVVEEMEAQRKVEQDAVELDRRLEQQFPTNSIGEVCDPP